MITRFWPLLIILALVVGCASTYEGRPAHLEQGNDYWNYLLYHQTTAEPQGELRLQERALSEAMSPTPSLALLSR